MDNRKWTPRTLIALAAPCDRSTPSEPALLTSEGSSASNFIRMSLNKLCNFKTSRKQQDADLFTPAQLWRVDGDEQAFDSTLLCVLHNALRDSSVFIHVPMQYTTHKEREIKRQYGYSQLEKLYLTWLSCVQYLIKRARRQSWNLSRQGDQRN